MPYHIHIKRLAPPRVWLLTAAAILSVALMVAGCGSSSSPGVAHLSSAKGASSASSAGSGSSPASTANPQQGMVEFAKCMRSNGVPNFQEPKPGGTGKVPVGANPAARSFKAAERKCQKFMGGGGLPGSGEAPSPQTLARFLRIARCMRRHGVYDFPDPRTTAPAPPFGPGIAELSDIEGVILLFPRTIDQQSPVFTRAAAACAFPLHNH